MGLPRRITQKNTDIKMLFRYKGDQPVMVQDIPTLHHLLFVEHTPVYTLGKSGKESNVLISEAERNEKGIEYYHINRGGDITFHGPGQLVGYPILDLERFKTDLGWYLRTLEEVIIVTMADYGLKGERSLGETGVWLDAHVKGRSVKFVRWVLNAADGLPCMVLPLM